MKLRSNNTYNNNKIRLYSEENGGYFHGNILKTSLKANKSAGWDETMHFHNVREITFLTPPLQNGFTFCVIVRQYHQIFLIWLQIIKRTNSINPIFNFAFHRRRGRQWWSYVPICDTQSRIERKTFSLYLQSRFRYLTSVWSGGREKSLKDQSW